MGQDRSDKEFAEGGGARASVRVDGCDIVYERFVRPGALRLVLVHGAHAHGGWWAAVAPRLAVRFDVTVPDLSGHGDSGHRKAYEPELWAKELAAVIADTGDGAVTVVGHSMGGRVAVYLASRHPQAVERLVLIETALRRPAPDGQQPAPSPAARSKKVYPDVDTALARFRLWPPESSADPQLLDQVAARSLMAVDGGWTWKHDPGIRRRFSDAEQHNELQRIRCPVAMVRGEHSPMIGADIHEFVVETLGRRVPNISVAGAYHHVPLDAPSQCARAVAELADTDH